MSYTSSLKVLAHVDRLAKWEAGLKPAPVTLEWSPSSACDSGCKFCHFKHTHVAGPLAKHRTVEVGKFSNVDVTLSAIEQAAAAGVRGIVWMGGGEPTLHPSWSGFVKFAHDCGVKQGVYTNGGRDVASDPDAAEALSWAVISLDYADADGYDRAKGTKPGYFERVLANSRRLIQSHPKCKVSASFVIGEDNYADVARMVSLSEDNGFAEAVFRPKILFDDANPAVREGGVDWVDAARSFLCWAADRPGVVCDISRFVAYRDWDGRRPYASCLGIRLNGTITPDGRVWVCPNRMGFEDSCLGNLTHESFAEVWARHPGRWDDFSRCRVMCRLHGVNCSLAPLTKSLEHGEFV